MFDAHISSVESVFFLATQLWMAIMVVDFTRIISSATITNRK
jgi:hypothetical protein